VPEVPNQLLFLRINTYDGQACRNEFFSLRGNIPKLLISVGGVATRGFPPLLAILHRELHPLQQLPDSHAGYVDAIRFESLTNVFYAVAHPLLLTHGIASSFVREDFF